jgi:adenylate cyclase
MAAYLLLVVRPPAALEPARRFVRDLDGYFTDLMFAVRGPRKPTGEVVIVDIDEASLRDPVLGQWPWPRDRLAALLERIHDAGPRAVGLDIVFAEPDRTSPARLAAELAPHLEERLPAELLARLDHDRLLGESLTGTPTVLGYLFLTRDPPAGEPAPPPFPGWWLRVEPPDRGPEAVDAPAALGTIGNIPAIAAGGATEGFFNIDPRTGRGVLRRVPLLMTLDGMPYPSLALETWRLGRGEQSVVVSLFPGARENVAGVRVGETPVPTDGRGFLPVNYRGPAGTLPRLSAAAVYHDRTDPARLAGKYVLVGASAAGLHDLKTTPFSNACSGVEVQATVLDNLLAGDALRHSREREHGVTLLILLVGGLGFTAVLVRRGALWGGAAGLAGLLAVAGIGYGGFFLRGELLGLTVPLLALGMIFLSVMLFNHFIIGWEARFIRQAFAHYVAPDVVEDLVRRPEALRLGGEKRELTVMFSDVRGFTTLSESMEPQELGRFLNRYMNAMTGLILEGRGTVDKFIGDAIMAMWGAPLPDPQHPRHAVETALAMSDRLETLRAQWAAEGLPAIEIGIGLNSGEMTVGNMGSDQRFDYTVLGDNVNLASRLEGLSKAYGVRIVVSEATRNACGEAVAWRLLDRVRVKGKEQPIRIYEPLGAAPAAAARAAAARAFEEAQRRYLARDWDAADAALRRLEAEDPQPVYRLYRERIARFRAEPPPRDWDGVYTFTSK